MKYLYFLVLAVLIISLAWIIFTASQSTGGTEQSHNETAVANKANSGTFSLSSAAFPEGATIPAKYTCDGDGALSPSLSIANSPEGTRSLVLIMHDPDIPQPIKDEHGIEVFDHWVVYGIPAGTREVAEGERVGETGLNGAGREGYIGPCPPPNFEPTTHRYIFTLYALKGSLQFPEAPTRAEVEAAMTSMIIGQTTLTGVYDRSGK